MRRFILLMTVGALAFGPAAAASAPHGWGGYDAANPITVSGPIKALTFENPQAEIQVKAADKVWIVTLAPTLRMTSRGVSADVIAVGKSVSAFGYRSTLNPNEMRAERITVDGHTYDMR